MMTILPKWLRTILPFRAKKASPGALAYKHVFVHPCVINQQPHIVYPRGLQESSPALFRNLRHYFSQQGYALKEDQRSDKDNNSYRGERRRLVPALLFTASMLFESSVHAEIEVDLHDPGSYQRQQIELRIVPTNQIREQIRHEMQAAQELQIKSTIKSNTARSIFEQLQAHYHAQDTDPDYILDDLKQIANYYSDFDEVIALFKTLADKNWQLAYSEHDWVTTASGNVFEVTNAVIHFNTRSAAQLKLNHSCKQNPICIASPADALLHELLHTHSMLVKTEEFIAQGGMNSVTYPYRHEYSIIEAERKLYARMTQRDAVARPSRHEHTGRTIKANCPTCIK